MGALVVAGGANIGGDIVLGGSLNVTGATFSGDFIIDSTTRPRIQWPAHSWSRRRSHPGRGAGRFRLHLLSGTGSTGVDTGALTVVGGLGVSENVYAGGEIHILRDAVHHNHRRRAHRCRRRRKSAAPLNVALDSQFWSETPVTDSTTAALVVSGGLGVVGGSIIGGDVHVLGSTDSTSAADGAPSSRTADSAWLQERLDRRHHEHRDMTAATTTGVGALIVSGGVNVGDGLWVESGVAHFGDATNTIDGTDGAVVVAGGMGVGLDLAVIGNITTIGGILQGPLGMGNIGRTPR